MGIKRIPVECYQRVVGYYRPLSDTNPGIKEQILDRRDLLTKKLIYKEEQNETQNTSNTIS